MNKLISKSFLLLVGILLLFCQTVGAVPTFQAYIVNGTATSVGEDLESWFSTDNPFDVIVVGSYSSKTVNLDQVTIAISVPEDERGTIFITGGDGATLLTNKTSLLGGSFYNPNADADEDILTDVTGDDGYDTKNFLPESNRLTSNHYPFQDGVSDFLIYGIGDFDDLYPIHNYNAEDGSTDIVSNSIGEEKTFTISVTGFTRLHIDTYGYDMKDDGTLVLVGSWWDQNPGSHDSTYLIPAPGAILLGSIGVGLVGWLKRRKTL